MTSGLTQLRRAADARVSEMATEQHFAMICTARDDARCSETLYLLPKNKLHVQMDTHTRAQQQPKMPSASDLQSEIREHFVRCIALDVWTTLVSGFDVGDSAHHRATPVRGQNLRAMESRLLLRHSTYLEYMRTALATSLHVNDWLSTVDANRASFAFMQTLYSEYLPPHLQHLFL